MDFPKFAIAKELLVITTYNLHLTMPYYSISSGQELQIIDLDSGSYSPILELEHGFP